MSSKISEIVKSVDPKDEVLKTYPGELDKKYGTLVLSKKRLLFVKEEGFLKKTYTTMMNLPYKEVKKIERNGMRLDFTDVEGKVLSFMSEGTALVVENALKEFIKTPQ
jgi:hypothetical protein